ncbi:MAG: DUF4390 domain-containing protein [Rubrivivax sp.]|nr:DUF4390 domain-containing protein [Rubrivivax sp.]
MPLPPVRRFTMQGLLQGGVRLGLGAALLVLVLVLGLGTAPAARAQGVDLATLQVQRFEGALTLDFTARVNLPRAVEEALHRGVPIYFLAEARLLRDRWYWRDERVTRVSRSWRLAYQPLTGSWRVGLGGLNQTFPSLSEALAIASRSAGWKLAELTQLDVDKSYYVEFSYRLDTTQLPGPMQFGLGGQGDWAVGTARVLKVDLGAE